jgi:predicted phosphodiesterase
MTVEPFTLPPGKYLFLSDIHVPYHDERALAAAIKHGKQNGCDHLLINGDFVDFHQISDHPKEFGRPTIKQELGLAEQMLGWMRHELGKPGVIYNVGNHEERWIRFLMGRAPEIFDLTSNLWHELLDFGRHDVTLVHDRRTIMAGHLHIYHGHTIFRGASSPVNPARTIFLQTNVCGIAGHLHRNSHHVVRRADGTLVSCWSVACLCDLAPFYARNTQWGHGFAEITVSKKGGFDVSLKKVIAGKVYSA